MGAGQLQQLNLQIDQPFLNVLSPPEYNYPSLKSKKQDLSFSCLEKAFQSIVGIQTISKNILKTLELYTENEGYNNAAELLADNNTFNGIDIVRS